MPKVSLYNKNGIKDYILVDDQDYALVSRYRWRDNGNGYAATCLPGERKKVTLMHRLIMGAAKGVLVDHVNQNQLDNRRTNLRLCDRSQNRYNAKISKTNRSGFSGVSWDATVGKWCAQLSKNRKHIHGGHHEKLEDAVEARNKLVIQHTEGFGSVYA